jgi:hypothetical protein
MPASGRNACGRWFRLKGFGIPAEASQLAPKKFARWLDALAHPPDFKRYPESRRGRRSIAEQ